MTIKTFWTILIKTIGIALVLSSLTVIGQFLVVLPMFGKNVNTDLITLILGLGALIVVISLYIFVLWLFVFRTAWLIDKLHLEKGFAEETINLNIQQSTVLSIAVIVLGGLVFIDSFPQLCRQTFIFFQMKTMVMENRHSATLVFLLIKTILGFLLMTNSKSVAKFIDRESNPE